MTTPRPGPFMLHFVSGCEYGTKIKPHLAREFGLLKTTAKRPNRRAKTKRRKR
jgi:hypothetical protein